jgi:hypothetical protein
LSGAKWHRLSARFASKKVRTMVTFWGASPAAVKHRQPPRNADNCVTKVTDGPRCENKTNAAASARPAQQPCGHRQFLRDARRVFTRRQTAKIT